VTTRLAAPAQRVPAPALVLTAVVSVQTGAALAKSLFADLGPTGATTVRLVSSAVLLLVLIRPRLPATGRWLLVAYGASLGCMNLSFYLALDRVPLGAAVTVEFLGPLAVAVAGSRRGRDFAAVAGAAAGILLLARGGTASLDLAGLGFAALAGACWACYILVSAAVGRHAAGGTPLALAMVVASAIVLPFGLTDAVSADAGTLARGAAVGLLSSVIPYSLELQALRTLPPRFFGVLLSLEPAAAALSGLLFLGETLALRQWCGIACVVAASTSATLSASRSSRMEVPGPD
jgi:inner membrane transporter RhtA